jgi:glycosyltransferase involved in cell wall biosynthesis
LIEFGIPEQGIRIVPHGVKTDIFRPMPADERLKNRQNLGIEEDEIVISNVGVPTWNKGLDILIEAVARLINSGRKIKLILKNNKELYGLGIEDTIQKFAKEHPSLVTDNFFSSVQLVQSTLNLDQLRALYCISDIYASPYRAEGFNLPVLEAMACGTYVLVTDGGATDDFFQDACGRKIKSDPRSLTVKEKYEGKYREPDLNSLIECIDDYIENKIESREKFTRDPVIFLRLNSWLQVTQSLVELV